MLTARRPNYQGELVFVTSRECRDVSVAEAESYIMGYTIGNDLSCRLFQLPAQNAGQFFYAKAFDKFAPIGPVLVSPEVFHQASELKLVTKVDGEVMQSADIKKDMVFSPAQILSFMSQSECHVAFHLISSHVVSEKTERLTTGELGTTIPAFTAVMSGTPAGVGAFKSPKRFLNDGETVEIEISNIGVLRNKILFPEGKQSNNTTF